MLAKTMSKTTTVAFSTILLVGGGSANALETQIGNTTVSLGGYVKADVIHNFDEDMGDLWFVNAIPVVDKDGNVDSPLGIPEGGSGQTIFHARETRLNFATSTPTTRGEVNTLIEFDWFDNATSSGGIQPRLRHAFVEWNGLLAGQYWSNFMPLVALPSTLDFNGPAGYVFVRQAQLRYTQPLAGSNQFAVALERPNSAIRDGAPEGSNQLDSIPDITAQFSGREGGLVYSLAGLLTFPEVEGDVDDSTVGFGVSANAGFTFPTGTTIGGQATYVDGGNRYLTGSAGFSSSSFIDDGDIETFSELGLMAYIGQPLSQTVTANLVLGYVDTDTGNDTDAAGILQDELVSVHVNVQWQPVDRLMYGVEFQWAERELSDGSSNDVSRLQASARWNF